tara:strand:- start:314 stop:964 length:651 start_codon:yes stop_codon:yes gene_type:complete
MNKIISLTIIMLSSCTSFNEYYDIFKVNSAEARISLIEKVSTSPFASIIVTTEDDNPYSIILDEISIQGSIWAASDGKYYLMNYGKVVETAGFENDIKLYGIKDSKSVFKSFCNKNTLGTIIEDEGLVSFTNPATVPLKYKSKFIALRLETISSLLNETNKETILVMENFEISKIKYKSTNYYWINLERCQMMRSIQHLDPMKKSIKFEIVKYPKE